MYILLSALHEVVQSLVTNNNFHYNNTRNKNNLVGQHFRYASSQKNNMIVFVNQIV